MSSFKELAISESIQKAIHNMGFEETTPIQRQTIPLALEGKDLIGQAQTGTGKTAAFGIPLIEKVQVDDPHIQGMVITPTRELAIQVSEELHKIGQNKRIRTLPIYGGQDIGRQIKSLKKRPHIIVGTPGRLMDHMRRKTIRTDHIASVVLDEADEMLNMGFIEDIETILSQVPEQRQTLLFSATMPKAIQRLAYKFMRDPELIRVKTQEMTVPKIAQHYVEVPEKKKFDTLCNLLDVQAPELAIIFGRTKRRVDELSDALNKRGYGAEGIHGDLTQSRREKVMQRFKQGTIDILVATDVAARGIDISGVTHIYNFDIPQDPESYVHRIGRTGRAGKEGAALTFVTPREIPHLRAIEKMTKHNMQRQEIPTIHEAREGQQRLAMQKLLDATNDDEAKAYKHLAEELLEEADSVPLLSAALKLLTKEPDKTPVRLTAESPLPAKKGDGKKGGRHGNRRGANHYKGYKDGKNRHSTNHRHRSHKGRSQEFRKQGR